MSIKQNIGSFSSDIARISAIIWNADRRLATINISLQILQSILPVASLYFIKDLIEKVVAGDNNLELALQPLILFGVVQLLIAILGQITQYVNNIFQQKISDHLSARVLQKAIDVDYEYYQNSDYHNTLHLAQQQSIHKAGQLLSNFNSALLNSMSLIFLTGFFLSLQSFFAILFVFLSLPLVIVKWRFGYAMLQQEHKLAPEEREAIYLHQLLTNIKIAKEVRVIHFGKVFLNKFKEIRKYIFKQKKIVYKKLTTYSILAEVAEIVAMIIIFGLLTKSALDQTITVGVFVIYIQGFQRLQSTSKNFLQAAVQILQQRIFLKDLFKFLDIEPKQTSQGKNSFPYPQQGLSINNLSFTYPDSSKQILHNISLNCKPGEIIAIVGENGSGKSTLVNLLAKLFSIQSGEITIEGQPIENIANDDFRKNSAFLFQDFEQYFFSVTENIQLGDSSTHKTEQDVKAAAILSGADEFIQKMADGYNTRLGKSFKNGEQISGGQWQKIALARMFYKDVKLVVLDEPTSALDALSEAELFNNIQKTLGDKMMVLISHRLYNLKMASRIYVMQEGEIVEQGSFDELVNNNGHFRHLYDAQKL